MSVFYRYSRFFTPGERRTGNLAEAALSALSDFDHNEARPMEIEVDGVIVFRDPDADDAAPVEDRLLNLLPPSYRGWWEGEH